MPEGFANSSFDPVSLYSQFQIFLGKHQANSCVAPGIGRCQNQEIPVGNPDLDVIEDFGVILGCQQPRRFGKAQSLHQAIDALRGQTGTAFGTTTRNNFATVRSSHAGTKTVNALTLQYAWLKRSFHDVDLTIRVKKFTGWLENEQPKQERHSMQCSEGIQWVKRIVGSCRVKHISNYIIRSFFNSFKAYYYCY